MSSAQCQPSEYLGEILTWVQHREREVSPVPLRSPQLRRRRQLVEWTAERAVELELSTLTVHMAVRYMDQFMSGHDIGEPQLYLVSLCSLMVASKMCDKELLIPRLSTLCQHLPQPTDMTPGDLGRLESVMLRFLDWDLSLPTCCYITELLITRSFSLDDWAQSQRHTVTSSSRLFASFTEMKMAFLRAVKEILDIYLQEESMIQNLPSLMAVAVLQASRCVLGLAWCEELDLVTGWGRAVTQYPTDCLVSLHKLQQEDDVIIIDEGYISNNWSITSTMAGER